jgi:hypothetical protein
VNCAKERIELLAVLSRGIFKNEVNTYEIIRLRKYDGTANWMGVAMSTA